MLYSLKKKDTGEIVTITSQSWGSSDGRKYTVVGKDGVPKVLSESTVEKNYEPVTYPNLKEALKVVEGLFETSYMLQKAIFPIMRRLHPGNYFNLGDLVHITSPIPKEYDHFSTEGYRPCSGTTVFIIVRIEDSTYSRYTGGGESMGMIGICRWRGKGVPLDSYDSEDICIPIFKDRFSQDDAYFYLQRFDQPY